MTIAEADIACDLCGELAGEVLHYRLLRAEPGPGDQALRLPARQELEQQLQLGANPEIFLADSPNIFPIIGNIFRTISKYFWDCMKYF